MYISILKKEAMTDVGLVLELNLRAGIEFTDEFPRAKRGVGKLRSSFRSKDIEDSCKQLNINTITVTVTHHP